ncbi:MAG: hypothetical protein SGARI_004861 [Bacillariaceae sp.]
MKTPCTPSTRDLLGRVQKLTLKDEQSKAVADACDAALAVLGNDHGGLPPAAAAPLPRSPPQDQENDLGFQTPPAALRRRKLSFVVTPPRIEKKASASDDRFDGHLNGSSHDAAAPAASIAQPSFPLLSQEDLAVAPTLCRKRLDNVINDPNGSDSNRVGNVFKRHVPMHSPIAGLTNSVVNIEFVAKLMAETAQERAGDDSASMQQPHFHQQGAVDPRRVAIYPRRESFLAKHSFPILDEAVPGEDAGDAANEQPVQGLMLPRALKMRKTSREDLQDLIQSEKELFSL